MDRYVEIQVLPDPEFTTPLLMGALVSKCHRGLVALDSDALGISFPEVQLEPPVGLGERLRLHGTETLLTQLMSLNWLTGMQDHTAVKPLATVPETAQYRTFFRVQAKSNPERLRRRHMKRKGEDLESARQAIPESAAKRLTLPYLTLTSKSTGQRFPIFINASPPTDKAATGTFSSYGLSRHATVPWF